MKIEKAREILSEITGAGKTRIALNPEKINDVEKAITRDDLRALLDGGAVTIKPEKGVSRGRAREAKKRKKKGRGRKPGSKKGTLKSRIPPKKKWMEKVRSLRKALFTHDEEGAVPKKAYRNVYARIKGNWFRNKKHLQQYLEELKKE